MARRVSLSAVLAIICLLGIVRCSGGAHSALPLLSSQGTMQTRNAESLSATPTPSPSPSPVVRGTIASVSPTQILIQGGIGCGYVDVDYTSSTPIAYNGHQLVKGVMAYVWGTGSCATYFVASYISLGKTATASPTPSPTPSPSPTPTPPIVSGTIAGVLSTQILIQGGAGCGYVNVNYTSSTPIAYNGYALTVGVVLNVWGTGSCATSFTATALSLGQLSSPTPSPTPTPTPTPSPSPTPTPTMSVTDTTFAGIVNPGQWPSNFRPYCANASANPSSPCPWNDSLPDNPSQLYPNSATIVANMFAASDAVQLPGDWSIGGDFNHATYLASSSDHLVTVSCTSYCGVGSATFAIPLQARAASSGYSQVSGQDCHMAVIEPDGTEWDMYQACGYTGQTSFSVSGLYRTSILGSGIVPNGGVTSGAALAGGIIRSDELARGVIPHALFASTNCSSGTPIYPGTAQNALCSSGTGPPNGARLQLTLTDVQINALGLPAWEAAILHAMHDYGVYLLDTSGGTSPGGVYFRFESQTQYAAYNAAYPYASMGLNISAFDTALNWGQSFRIVSSCYAQETCTQ